MSHISIGISAFRAAQAGLTTTSNNIANAGTDGYSRQRVELAAKGPLAGNTSAGTGVDVVGVSRYRDAAVESSITAGVSGKAASEARLAAMQGIESILAPSEYSIHSSVTEFFNRAEQFASSPSNTAGRQELVSAAAELSAAIRKVQTGFAKVRQDLAQEIQTSLKRVNEIASQIAELNRNIRVAQANTQSPSPNNLLDTRDKLINELASLVDIDVRSLIEGADPIVAAGDSMYIGDTATTLSVEYSNGHPVLVSSSGYRGVDVRSGSLGGLMDTWYSTDLEIMSQFEEWATTLLREIDTIQATGDPGNGGFESLRGHRGVISGQSLTRAETIYPLNSGDLTVSVTDSAGARISHRVTVDVAADSLDDVVTRLDAIAGISAGVDAASGYVVISADAGSRFDFVGGVDSVPRTSSIAGTAQPVFSGNFTGLSNDTWQFEALDSGEAGIAEPLRLRITEASTGQIVGVVDVGRGYGPNQPLPVADGISIALGGSLQAGDTFEVQVTAQPDQTGLLASLGLGTFFTGDTLSELAVAPEVVAAPQSLAVSGTGSANSPQASQLSELRTLEVVGSETAEERLATITALSGSFVAAVERDIGHREAQLDHLQGLRDAVSGVDPNEELLKMLEYQRAFQAASRFVTAIDDTIDDLMNLIR